MRRAVPAAVAGVLLVCVGAWAARPVARLAYEGSDANVYASLEGGAESASGEPARWGEVTLASRFVFELLVEAEAGVELAAPDMDLLLGPGMVVERVEGPRVSEQGAMGETLAWTVVARPSALGVVDLGEPRVRYRVSGLEGGEERAVVLEAGTPSSVPVRGLAAVEGEGVTAQSEAAGPRAAVGGRWGEVIWWGVALGVAALLVLVAVGWLAAAAVRRSIAASELRRRAPALPRPAHEVALERLDALEAAGERGEASPARVAAEACDVARAYIGGRFRVRAPRMTTREFLESAQRSHAIGDRAATLGALLEKADRIKFAGGDATDEEARGVLRSVRSFVIETARPVSAFEGTPYGSGAGRRGHEGVGA